MELSQKLTQMNEYNIKQDQLNKAFVSAERTKEAFRSQRETAEKSLLSLKQEERDMTKQGSSTAFSPEQKDKLKKRIEDVLGEIKATEMEEQKCYDTEMMLYQQQQQLKNVRENLGNESQLLPIEPGLMKAPQKPNPSQFSSSSSSSQVPEKGLHEHHREHERGIHETHGHHESHPSGTHEHHHPTEEMRETHEQHGTRQLPGLRQTHGLQGQSGSHEQSSGVQKQPGLHGQSGIMHEQSGKGVQGQSSGMQSGVPTSGGVSGISGESSTFGGPGTRQGNVGTQGTGSRVQGQGIGGDVQERGLGSAAKEQLGLGTTTATTSSSSSSHQKQSGNNYPSSSSSSHQQQSGSTFPSSSSHQQQSGSTFPSSSHQQQSGSAFPSSSSHQQSSGTSSSRQGTDKSHGPLEERGPQQERAIQGHDIGIGVQGQRGTQEHGFGTQGQRGTQEHSFGAHGVQGQQHGVQGVQGMQGHGVQGHGVQGHGVQGQQHGMQGVQGQGMQEVMPERRLHEQFGTPQHGQSAMSSSNTWEQPLPDAKGTIVGVQDYDTRKAREDARNLRSAMKGAGADRGVIAQIAGTRSAMQRQMIAREYALMEGKEKQNLIDDLRSEVTGDLGKLVVPLFMQPGEFDAYLLKKAMEGIGCDSDILIEVLCTRTNRQIEDIKTIWTHTMKSKYTLEERIADETKKLIGTSPFRGLCLKLLAAKRPQNMKPDTNRVQAEAEELHRLLSGDSKDKDCKAKFIEIFTERSWVYIAEFVKKFQTLSKDWTLESAIRKEFGNSSDTSQALRTIADFSIQPYDFWAEKLRVAMKGYGTDDSKLIRIVVSRCEIDLLNVVHVFGQRHGNGQDLKKWIETDTSGEYRTLLLLLCGF